MSNANNIILGIDPGTNVMGYGLIQFSGKKAVLIEMGVLKLGKYANMHQRLLLIFKKVQELIKAHQVNHFAIEAPFYAKNVQSMLKLGRAQGVAIAAAAEANLNIVEYMPKRVKQSVSGNGNATKEQVWQVLQQTLNFKEKPEFLDATDALAVALCMFYELSGMGIKISGNKSNWDQFVKNNPERLKK
jgi:crossover junction endodeoxyribonuclease RuvC